MQLHAPIGQTSWSTLACRLTAGALNPWANPPRAANAAWRGWWPAGCIGPTPCFMHQPPALRVAPCCGGVVRSKYSLAPIGGTGEVAHGGTKTPNNFDCGVADARGKHGSFPAPLIRCAGDALPRARSGLEGGMGWLTCVSGSALQGASYSWGCWHCLVTLRRAAGHQQLCKDRRPGWQRQRQQSSGAACST